MYLVIVLATMLILPLASLGLDVFVLNPSVPLVAAVTKWFVFWALGVRLFVAGLRQVVQPSFTARHIFEIDDPKSHVVVQELGFANLSLGLVGLLTLGFPAWTAPALVLGAVFYGLAGVNHVFRSKNATEWIAMVSDLFAFFVFGVLFFVPILGR